MCLLSSRWKSLLYCSICSRVARIRPQTAQDHVSSSSSRGAGSFINYLHCSYRECAVPTVCIDSHNRAQCVHLAFKRNEPRSPLAHVSLLCGPLALLSPLLWSQYGAALSTCIAFAFFLAVLTTSVVLYRLSPIHPLARYPGPLPHKISKWYFSWIVMQGQSHIHVQRLHERYGDVVRIGMPSSTVQPYPNRLTCDHAGPNEVSIRNAGVLQHMFGTLGLPKSECP